ncbi:uncharacterized protein Gasu_31810 [Galdieria sulphuraria]|uniref:Uncharacterized protein n=1 Tax=Galdieria sulphuraria TaxID=130081 RepID=M2W150_GALSU|nr:uncharacterized protein Gasu_31810 [Galdieria sulphuraria]EME29351.1 hypothetical protein Gasu_31810 [Galdieria sulphuraria]|eukprot:XP_005705871.1 hypothetical protein Gasu_31810 [Galdieria sulphuraria]
MEITSMGFVSITLGKQPKVKHRLVTLCPGKYGNKYMAPLQFPLRSTLKAVTPHSDSSPTGSDMRLGQGPPEDLLREIQRLREENERLRKSAVIDSPLSDDRVEPIEDDRPLGLPLEDGKFLPFSVVEVKNPTYRIIPILGEAQLVDRELLVNYEPEILETFWQNSKNKQDIDTTLPVGLWSKCSVPEWSFPGRHVVVPSCEIISYERRPIGIFIPGSLLKVSFVDGIDHKVLMIFETKENYLSQKDSSDGIWLWQCPEKSTLQIGRLRIAKTEWNPMGRLLLCLSPKIESPYHEAQTFLEVDEVF